MRRFMAAFALLVTTWSNAAAFPCGSPSRSVADAHPGGAHSHAGHGADHGGLAGPEQSDDAGSDAAPECGILMACGALLRAGPPPLAQAPVPPSLDDAPLISIGEPSAVDLTQDPPPPRRPA